MSNKIHVRPVREGVPMPGEHALRTLPKEGASVPRNAYYNRLLKQGDIEQVAEVKATEKPTDNKSAPKAVKPKAAAKGDK